MRAWVEEMEAVPLMLGMVVPMGFVVIVKFIERCAPVVCGWLLSRQSTGGGSYSELNNGYGNGVGFRISWSVEIF